MEDERSYYAILGVPLDATEAEIRRAYRARAKELHPDGKPAGEQPEAIRQFNLLTEAYETLKDPECRQAYDAQRLGARQLAPHGAKEGKPPRAFAMGLVLGILLAVAAVGAKVFYDRAGINGTPKSQESLRIQKAEKPAAAAPAAPETSSHEPEKATAGPAPVPRAASQAEHQPEPRRSGTQPDQMPSAQARLSAAAPLTASPAAPSVPSPEPSLRSHSQFAVEVLSLEGAISSDGGGAAAYRLVSLVNSANAIEELSEAASLASKPETVDLIQSRIQALKEEHGSAAITVKPRDPSAQGSGGAHIREDGTIEVAAGARANETLLRLRPGNGASESFSDCASCPEMVAIPGGQAVIGSRPDSAAYRPEEAPAHKISIRRPIAVSKHGISAENWRACVEAGACRPTLASYLSIGPGVPATRVSWFDTKSYVEWLSQRTGRHYRLLSEAEWEYATQAGQINHGAEGAAGPGNPPAPEKAPPLGLLHLGGRAAQLWETKPNAWGLHPLPVNLLEWVEDCWHASYVQAPSDGLPWLSGNGGDCAYRVVRGIAATGGEFGGRRLAARAREFADARSPTLGFRVARELSVPAKAALDTAAGARGKSARGD